MNRIENFTDFINEAEDKEVELKVDNSGYTKYLTWFKKNTDLFKAHRSGKISSNAGLDHSAQTKKLADKGMNVEFPYGYCYPCSQFVFYTLGGYSSDYDLKLIKKINFDYKGTKGTTTHWFVQHKTNGRIIDITKEQFDHIPGFDIEELYPEARRANLGFPYYTTKNGKQEFGHTVPCMQVLKLYDKWREEKGQIKGLEKYWKAANYASERREQANEMYTQLELNNIPINEQHCFRL
jgi:hypothetical protein